MMNRWQSWYSGILVTGPDTGIREIGCGTFPESMYVTAIVSIGHSGRGAGGSFDGRPSRPAVPPRTPTALRITAARDTGRIPLRNGCDLILSSSRLSAPYLLCACRPRELLHPTHAGLQEPVCMTPELGDGSGPAGREGRIAHLRGELGAQRHRTHQSSSVRRVGEDVGRAARERGERRIEPGNRRSRFAQS